MAATTEAEASTTISETEAAHRLGVNASTLRLWRLGGKLAPGLYVEKPSLAPNGRPKVQYDEEWVNDYAENGEANRSIFPDAD